MSLKDKKIVTGAAGFIGSNLTIELLELGAKVTGIDNLYNGRLDNLTGVLDNINFQFIKGDIRDLNFLIDVLKEIEIVYHEAAFTSVPQSVLMPLSIVGNSSFYIIIGYVCYWIGLPLSGFYFLFLIVFSFLLMTLYIILCKKNKGSYYFLRSRNSTLQAGDLKKTSFFKKLITLIPLNGFLLIVFIVLIIFLNILKTSIFIVQY